MATTPASGLPPALGGTVATAPSRAAGRWLFGPLADLLLGCGLGYALVFVGLSLAGPQIRGIEPVTLIPFLLVTFAGVPHYGATLLRVYERAEDRRAYVFFTVYASAFVWLVFAVGLHWIAIGSLMLTVYLTWSPWHYTGQNYGLMVMFLRRRGVPLDPATKRWIAASFWLSYAMTFLTMHAVLPTTAYAPASYAGTAYRFLSLGIDDAIRVPLLVGVSAGYALCLLLAGSRLLHRASLADLAPSLLLVASQALWFIVPIATREWQIGWLAHLDPLGLENAAYSFLWIAAAHSIQYLWVTTYYAGAGPRPTGKVRFLGKTLLAGAAIWTVPTLIFAPGLLGRIPFEGGLALLTASAVNLQHFLLDGAIWKLRDGRVARILLRARTSEAETSAAPTRGWLGGLVWATGIASLAFIFGVAWVVTFVVPAAAERGDTRALFRLAQSLDRIGRPNPRIWDQIARLKIEGGDRAGARYALERSLVAQETPGAWLGLAQLHEGEGRWDLAVAAYDSLLRQHPSHVAALYRRGLALIKQGDPDEARVSLERAAAVAPDDKLIRLALERVDPNHSPATP